MPHIEIRMITGRSDETKKLLAAKLRAFLAEELVLDPGYISVSVRDIERIDWDNEIQMIDRSAMVIPPEIKLETKQSEE